MEFSALARLLIISGIILLAVGVLILVMGRVPGIGRLPGDIVVRNGGLTIVLPLATMLLISVILTVLLNIAVRFWR